MLDGYDSPALDKVEVLPVYWIIKFDFVNPVPLFGAFAAHNITQSSEAVRSELRFCFFVKYWDHIFHHLGVTFSSVIVLSIVIVFVPGASVGRSEPKSI